MIIVFFLFEDDIISFEEATILGSSVEQGVLILDTTVWWPPSVNRIQMNSTTRMVADRFMMCC